MKKFMSKFIRGIRGTSVPMPKPVPKYRYTMMLVTVHGVEDYQVHLIEYKDGPVKEWLVKETEYGRKLNKLFQMCRGLPNLHVLIIDHYYGTSHTLPIDW